MNAVIVCNGSVGDYSCYGRYFENTELIICVDGGARHIKRFGVKPHVLLGDFDSIPEEDFKHFQETDVEIIRFPREKNMTDTELAIEFAAGKGCKSIVFIGALGTRFDHSLANIFLLKKMLDRGIHGLIVNEQNEITLIRDRIQLHREDDMKVTLLPLSEAVQGVTTRGMYYPLKDATMEMGTSWGVSNEFDSEAGEVTVKSGLLLVIKARD